MFSSRGSFSRSGDGERCWPQSLVRRQPGESCPFRLSVINDEICRTSTTACSFAANGVRELDRTPAACGTRRHRTQRDEVDRSRQILEKYKLRVTRHRQPAFQRYWPAARNRKRAAPRPVQVTLFKAPDERAERSIGSDKAFQTDRIRCCRLWRIEDQNPTATANR